jgi:hypothetical protein
LESSDFACSQYVQAAVEKRITRAAIGPVWLPGHVTAHTGCHKDPFTALGICDALRDDQQATNHFFLATQGMVAPQTFFNDENIGRIIAGAARVSG